MALQREIGLIEQAGLMEPVKNSQVSVSLRELDAALIRLEQTFSPLYDKISMITHPEVQAHREEKKSVEDPDNFVRLVQIINEYIKRINSYNDHMVNLIDRIESI